MPEIYTTSGDHIVGSATPTGNCARLTWEALEASLRRAGVIRPGEQVKAFYAGETGLTFTVERL